MISHHGELRFHPVVLTLLVSMIIACFTVGYHRGASKWESQFLSTVTQNERLEWHYTTILETCNSELNELIGKFSVKNNTVYSILSENADLTGKMLKLSLGFHLISDEDGKCRAEVAIMTQQSLRGTEAPSESLKTSENQLQNLYRWLSDLTDGGGMIVAAIFTSLQKLRQKYTELCHRRPGCTIFSDDSLLLRWSPFLDELPLRRQELEASSMKKMLWVYNAQNLQETADIFLPKDDAAAPTYFGRTGNPQVLVGEAESHDTDTSVLGRLHLVQKMAACAYRLRDPSIYFPSTFQWLMPHTMNTAALHDLLHTPLITFCMDCIGSGNRSDFWHECEKAAVDDDFYGRRDFWAVRSMVRPHPSVVHDARNYYVAHALREKKVLAVVAQNVMEDCLARQGDPRGSHFLYLAANFPEARERLMNHVSNETIFQCSPTAAQLVQQITNILEQEAHSGEQKPFNAIYMSISSEMMQELKRLERKPTWWDNVLPHTDAIRNAHDELVDLTIASQADGLLVSPYFAAAQYVVESFLLRHELQPLNHVWFF